MLKKVIVPIAMPSVSQDICIKKITIGNAVLPSQIKNLTGLAESRQWASLDTATHFPQFNSHIIFVVIDISTIKINAASNPS